MRNLNWKHTVAASVIVLASVAPARAATISLGAFNFDSNLFGNTLVESDGGTYRAANWLNVANADPGNPGALTGANFLTGIANIGLNGNPLYTIGYNTPIVNGAGADLGIVVGFSFPLDTFRVDVSSDGTTFLGFQSFAGSTAVNTGVSMNYFYAGSGPFSTDLAVIPVDLSDFGVAAGGTISAVTFSSAPQGDVFRIAGFGTGQPAAVPEPTTMALLGTGLLGLIVRSRRKHARS